MSGGNRGNKPCPVPRGRSQKRIGDLPDRCLGLTFLALRSDRGDVLRAYESSVANLQIQRRRLKAASGTWPKATIAKRQTRQRSR